MAAINPGSHPILNSRLFHELKVLLGLRTARYALFIALAFLGLWLGYGYHGNYVLKPVQEHKVVFIGDSITNHWDLPDTIGGYRVIKCGVDGETTFDMVERFKVDVHKVRPDKVFILGGINDIQLAYQSNPQDLDHELQKTAHNIKIMTESAQGADIEPVLCSVLPVGEHYSAAPPDDINAAVRKLNVSIEELAQTENVAYLDLGQVLSYPDRHQLKEEYARPDDLHISPLGYAQLTQAVTNFLP